MMDKPTIFFSHSSKDSELILPFKKKIQEITGNMVNIFMSSDGQSIPFGRNWVSEIEEGLEEAQIMFIFVTPYSIKSNWIYFEAGYAYSKGIEVIPVGIGVHVGELEAPLNLLQGFDVLSYGSLNNFISIINKKFSACFKEDFTEDDFASVRKIMFEEENDFAFSEFFCNGIYECCSQYLATGDTKEIIRYDVDKYFHDIKDYLDCNGIDYTISDNKMLVNGIKIVLSGREIEPENGIINQGHKISFYLSMYNFKDSFELFVDLQKVMKAKFVSMELQLADQYDCLYKEEQISSIVSIIDDLAYQENDVTAFRYKKSVNWWINNVGGMFSRNKNRELGVAFEQDKVKFDELVDFFNCIYKAGIIFKK